MRKNAIVIFTLLFCSFVLTSFSTSVDGRAVVARPGTLPKGIFAKTVGYLPGDSISVTNLTNKTTIDILVIGSIDPTEGIAILLSPEAADLLGLESGSNAVVKVTKRSGQLDETVSGTAVIGNAPSDSDFEEMAAAAAIEESEAVEEIEEAEEIEEIIEEEPDEEDELDEFFEENLDEFDEEDALSAEPDGRIVLPEPEEEIEEIIEEELVPDERDGGDEDFDEPFERVSDEPLFDYDEEDELDAVDEIAAAPYEGEPEEVEIAEEAVEMDELDDFDVGDSEIETVAPPVQIIEDEPEVETVFEERVQEDVFAASEPSVPVESERVLADELSEEKPRASAETVAADVLPPIDSRCPQRERDEVCIAKNPFDEEKDINKPFVFELCEDDRLDEVAPPAKAAQPVSDASGDDGDGPLSIVLVPSEPNPPEDAEPEPPVRADVPEKPAPAGDFSRYTVGSLSELERGMYYVQIAMYSEQDNIRAAFEKYGASYPIVLVPISSGRGMQVLVGPLNMDEYGAVLNRFKADGFKDAFLRKIR